LNQSLTLFCGNATYDGIDLVVVHAVSWNVFCDDTPSANNAILTDSDIANDNRVWIDDYVIANRWCISAVLFAKEHMMLDAHVAADFAKRMNHNTHGFVREMDILAELDSLRDIAPISMSKYAAKQGHLP
jgi:hypothetical protein